MRSYTASFKFIPKTLLILYILDVTAIGHSQTIIDSLLFTLNHTENSEDKVLIYKEISKQFYNLNLDSAIEYGNIGLKLAQEIGFEEGIADLNNNLGIYYRFKGEYEVAINHFFESLRIKQKNNDNDGIASTSNNIGGIYEEMEDADQAINYYNQSVHYYDLLKDTLKIATLKMNIGNTWLLKGLYDSALINYYSVKPVFEKSQNLSSLHKIYLNIGESYENKKILDSARFYYEKALSPDLFGMHEQWYSRACLYMGRLLLKNDLFNDAFQYLIKAYTIGAKLENIRTLRDASDLLMNYYTAKGKFDSSYYYAREYIKYNNNLSFDKLNRSLGIAETEYKYQSTLRENEIKLSRQRFFRNFMILVSFLILLLTIYMYRSYRHKQKANRLLAEIDELKSRMFSNISHEFRTPLTLILGPLDEMIEEGESKRPSIKTLKMMQRNASRLLILVNQMLDLSKMDAGKLKLELVENDIVLAMRTIILPFSSLAEQKHIHFKYEIPDHPCITWFDPDKLEKITNNLLSNAFKFTPENGTVKVVLKLASEAITISPPFTHENPLLELSVEDTGKGISKEHLEKVFDRFHQVEGASEIEQIGTGIGLALTKELVNLMHGKVTVESTPGKGSIFKILVPLGKNHLKEKEFIILETEEITAQKKTKIQKEFLTYPEDELYRYDEGKEDLPLILIVDDHPDIRTHIRQKLKNFRIMEAADGVIGMDISVEHLPDLIVTDLMMPNMDGVEFCKKLKTDERTSHIPVIMLTAKVSVENRIEGLETGADDYITKPFNMRELMIRINNLIEQRRKLRERFSREVTLQPKDIAITSADEKFLNRTIEIIEKNMGDGEFDVTSLRDEVGLSHMQLFRKLKALTDQAPSDFIRTIRLKRAAQLMQQKFGNIAEITYEVGFNNLSYFAKCFREMFGVSPSEYMKKN